jgi:hypothetical protein
VIAGYRVLDGGCIGRLAQTVSRCLSREAHSDALIAAGRSGNLSRTFFATLSTKAKAKAKKTTQVVVASDRTKQSEAPGL